MPPGDDRREQQRSSSGGKQRQNRSRSAQGPSPLDRAHFDAARHARDFDPIREEDRFLDALDHLR